MPQLSIPEEICLGKLEISVWIGIVGAFSDMAWFPWIAVFLLAYEACRRELARSCAPNHVEVQKSVEGHAEADGARLKPVLESMRRCLEKVPN